MNVNHRLDQTDEGKDGSGDQPAEAPIQKDPLDDQLSSMRPAVTASLPDIILQSGLMKFLMNSATWFSLVGRDIFASYVTDTVSYDNVCDIILAVCFFLFLLEWTLNNCNAKYRGTYFFWLDFLSLITMIPDVLLAFGVNIGANVNVSKVGRSARAGARSQKLVTKPTGISADIKKQLTVLSKLLIKKYGSINKSFKEIDTDGDGNISIGQFQDVMQKIGIAQESINIISKHADSDGSGTLDFKEYREALAAQSAFEMPEIIEVELGARLTTLSITKILTLASVILFMLDAIDSFLPGSQITTLETTAANLATIYDVYYVPDDPAVMFVFQMFFAKFIVDWESMQDPASVSMGFTSKIALLQKRLGYGTGFPGYGENWNTKVDDCFSSALKHVSVTRDVNDPKSVLVLWCSTAYKDLRQDWLAYFESIGRVKSRMPNGKTGSWNVAVMGVTNAGYIAFLNVTYTMTLSTLLVLTSFFVQTANSSVLITPLRKIVKVFVDFNSNSSAPIRLTEAEIRNFNPNDILSSIEFGSKRLCRLVQSAMGEAGHDLIPKILAGTKVDFLEVRGDRKASFLILCNIQEHASLIESFQGDSILIFNRIADIFHSTLSKDCFGEAGQSTERGFVGYWKFDETLFPVGSTFTWNFANFALQAAVLSSIRLQSDEVMAAFSSDERWSGKRHISETITFSLHLGSVVSGLMGSHFKFDVTSVSSSVNVLFWLGKAASFYSSGVLLSSQFVDALPPETKSLVRKIEFVKSRLKADPAFLYTFDVPISEFETIEDIILEAGVSFSTYELVQHFHDVWHRYRSLSSMLLERRLYFER
jgi:class 3 adenylate cyclase